MSHVKVKQGLFLKKICRQKIYHTYILLAYDHDQVVITANKHTSLKKPSNRLKLFKK